MSGLLTVQSTLVIIGSLIINFSLAAVWMQWEKIHSYIAKYEKHLPLFVAFIILVTWAFIFLIYQFPISGDVVSFFIPQGKEALSGALPNRDFASSYMPLFPYVMGLIYSIYPNKRSLSLFFALCLCGFVFLFYTLLHRSEEEYKNSSVLFIVGLLNSVVLILGIGYQQDELYILFLSGFLFLALKNKRDLLAGILTGLILLLTKATIIVFLSPFFLMGERKKDFLIGACLSTIPVLALFMLLGFSPTMMLRGESTAVVPPSLLTNLRIIPSIYLFFKSSPLVAYLLNASLLVGLVFFVMQKHMDRSLHNLLNVLIVVWLSFVVMSLKSLTSYRLLIIPFLPFVLDTYRQKWKNLPVFFAIYCFMLSVYYMLYEDWNKITRTYYSFPMVHQSQIPQWIILTAMEILIVLFEIAWIFLAANSLTKYNKLTNAKSKSL